jgi:hypothetical protein
VHGPPKFSGRKKALVCSTAAGCQQHDRQFNGHGLNVNGLNVNAFKNASFFEKMMRRSLE